MSVRDELRETLLTEDSEYRHAYADEILNLMVCTQLRVIREQQQKTQGEIAEALGTTQTAISRLENVDYSAWNIRTLKKLAKAFDLRLRITFETFGTLWRDVQSLNREALERPTIDKDPEFIQPEHAASLPDRLAQFRAYEPSTGLGSYKDWSPKRLEQQHQQRPLQLALNVVSLESKRREIEKLAEQDNQERDLGSVLAMARI